MIYGRFSITNTRCLSFYVSCEQESYHHTYTGTIFSCKGLIIYIVYYKSPLPLFIPLPLGLFKAH